MQGDSGSKPSKGLHMDDDGVDDFESAFQMWKYDGVGWLQGR